SWIWAIGNSVWIGLLALVPYVGFIMSIVLGIKGREWAWQAKHWDSVEHFNKVQRNWSMAGLVIVGVSLILVLLLTVLIVITAVNPAAQIQQTPVQ
ncbi:MAG: ribonuclease G, partial [bacterium]|nr:ribonuclease G [bacterium]